MGTYCSVRDVRLALTPNASETGRETAAMLPDYQIDDAIDEAEGTIDAYLGSRYAIVTAEIEVVNPDDPLETWVFVVAPAPVRAWTRDIAAYLAALTFRMNKDLTEDDPIRLRYSHVMNMLTAVRDHQMNIPLPELDNDDQGVVVYNLYEGDLFTLEDFNLGVDDKYYDPQRFISARVDV